jgi:Tat protein secretion system quality control protein TatD with DNase activity
LEAQITITDTHTHLYAEEFDQDKMMQRALWMQVFLDFLFLQSILRVQAMYDLENNYPENVFLMMGLHPTYVKDNFFGGITTCGGRTNSKNSMQLAKLVSICIGTKPICLSSKSL